MLAIPAVCPVCKNKQLKTSPTEVECPKCRAYRKTLNVFQKAVVWARGESWWWRLPILMWFAVMLIQNLKDYGFAIKRTSNPFSFLDLGLHEIGHLIFSPFGQFMYILGGSLFQVVFPLLFFAGCLQKRWYFAACMCWCWLGLNLFDVATYVADARARLLPLTTGFGGLYEQGSDEVYDRAHDWYQILSRLNHLDSDLGLASALRVSAVLVFLAGLLAGGYLLLQMYHGSASKQG